MEKNILFYFFSTIAQVLAAISALLAVFTHFKINEIKDFLIGDGEATLRRMDDKGRGYVLDNKNLFYKKRLRDAVVRKNTLGIKEVIDQLALQEMTKRETLFSNPTGLQFLQICYENRQTQIKNIKKLTINSIVIALIAIFISLISLIFANLLIQYQFFSWILIGAVLIMTLFSMIFTVEGVFLGLKDHENL